MSTADSNDVIIEARGLVKRYGRVVALRGTDLELQRGEVLGVIGDNGAGKSTLIKCLSGVVQPDQGTISIDGAEVSLDSPTAARAAGVETVHQSLAVSAQLDIASNLFLGREIRRSGPVGKLLRLLDDRRMQSEAAGHLSKLGIKTIQDPKQVVEFLSGGQRQAVAVARAAAFGSRVVIMDEPTAALGVRESNAVLDLVRRVRDQGVSVILISHNMPHVFSVCDRIHIQRLGARAASVLAEDVTMSEAVAIMTGATEDIPVMTAADEDLADD